MDLNKLKINNIKELEIKECEVEIDKIVRKLLEIESRFENAKDKAIEREHKKIEEFLTKELNFVKDNKANFIDYRLENDEVGKVKIVISDNWIIIQGKEFNYYLDTEYDLCSLDWKIEDDFGEGHIKHKNKSIKSKEQWNKELIELRKIQRTYEDTMGQLMIWKGDIFTIEVENKKVKSLVDFIKEMSDLPIFLINDANSGALAEKMYGLGKNISNYIYLHIMNGIGAGLVLENKLHTGNLGQSGEIGHTSINFSGPLCSCGNNGCLDYYTSVSNLIKRIESLSHIYPNSPLINCKDFSLVKLIDEANNKDSLAMFLLDEFCTYVSYALVNTLTLIDCSSIIIGYDFNIPGTFIENTLLKKLTASASFSKYKKISVRHSNFGANAPLIGSIAIVSYNFFNGSINFY